MLDRRKRARRRPGPLAESDRDPGFLLRLPTGREGWLVARRARAARRGLAVLAWTLPAMLIQAVCLILPGHAKVRFAQVYWATLARLIGVRVRVIGTPVKRSGGRRVIYVSNHSSWVDVPVIGGYWTAASSPRRKSRAGPSSARSPGLGGRCLCHVAERPPAKSAMRCVGC